MPLPVLAGNLDTALQQPDTVVITRNMARKYFHRDLPIGDTLMVQTTTAAHPGAPPPAPSGIRCGSRRCSRTCRPTRTW